MTHIHADGTEEYAPRDDIAAQNIEAAGAVLRFRPERRQVSEAAAILTVADGDAANAGKRRTLRRAWRALIAAGVVG
jgi:hypothetical protein